MLNFFVLVFRISLPCNGLMDARIDFIININITMSPSSNVTSLSLKRNKTCQKGHPQLVLYEDESILAESSAFIPTKNPFYILVGCASLLLFKLTCIFIFCYFKSHKGRSIERQRFEICFK